MIKVSILIPVYNQEELIKRCLNSIPARDDIEVIVIDDCSTDNSFKVIYDNYPMVRLFKNEKNLGVGLTRNRLLEKATGEYIFFLDSDDYLYTDKFEYVLDNILKDQIALIPRSRRNDNITFHSGVHRGDFLKRAFINGVWFRDMRTAEDREFKKEVNALPNYKQEKINIVVYHYNEPRIGSLT
jgi:glycosyltransferase involved in cell wall biosynthesis